MLRAIAFDLWETLITETPAVAHIQHGMRRERLGAILHSHGWGAATGGIDTAYRVVWEMCQELYWDRDHDIPTRTQIVHFLELLELDPRAFDDSALETLERAYAAVVLDALPDPVEAAPSTLAWCRERGLRIGLVSNTGRTPGWVLREVLDRLGMAGHLDAMVFSNEIGLCKPRPAVFEAVCDQLGVNAGETVFVGDNLYADVFGAKRFGMRAIHFDPESPGLAVAKRPVAEFDVVPDATVRHMRSLPRVLEPML